MLKNLFSKKILYIFAILVITRLIYTIIGVYARENLLNKDEPFASWTYDSRYQFINVWTVWDSGFYYGIAKDNYPEYSKSLVKTEIQIPPTSWVKVFLGYGEIGDSKESLPAASRTNNTLFLINDTEEMASVPLQAINVGIPYCAYAGPIDYERDVKVSNQGLFDPNACVGETCVRAYVSYFSVAADELVFQEYFDQTDPEAAISTIGKHRPAGSVERQYEGFGCKSVEKSDVQMIAYLDYKETVTPYPFLPLYSYLSRYVGFVFRDIIISGLLISNIALFLSALFLYKLLSLDFDERLAFNSTLFYLVFPFGFILSGFFTESLFNLLFFSSLYFAKRGNYILGSFLAMFSSITRILGVLTLFPLYFIYKGQSEQRKLRLSLASLIFIPIPLIIHVYNIYKLTGEWAIILDAQQAFGRVGDGTFSSLISYLLGSSRFGDFEFFTFLLSLFVISAFLIVGRTKEGKKLPTEYVVITAYMFIVPFLSGVFTSFPRYTLSIFPLFVAVMYFAERYRIVKFVLLCSFVLGCVFMVFWSLSSRLLV